MTLVSLSLHPVDRAREARTCARAVWYRTSPLLSLSVKRVTGARFWEASTWAQAKEEGASERERERESKNERERERNRLCTRDSARLFLSRPLWNYGTKCLK